MEEIPNKIKNLMGITAEVNLLQENGKDCIEIVVQSPILFQFPCVADIITVAVA